MTGYTKKQIIRILEDVIDGDRPVVGWDDLISIRHHDDFTNDCAEKCRDIEKKYSGRDMGMLLTEEGVRKVSELREELIRLQEG
jgi:hypothetical protein